MIELLMLLFGAYVGYVIGVNQSDWGRGFDIGYERGRKEREKEEHERIDKGHGDAQNL